MHRYSVSSQVSTLCYRLITFCTDSKEFAFLCCILKRLLQPWTVMVQYILTIFTQLTQCMIELADNESLHLRF